jgi:hypothetical protein
MSNDSKTQRATGQLPILPQIKIDSPCSMNWDELDGDAQKRFCNSCQLHVHNFSEMHLRDVKEVLCSSSHVCAKIIRRPDGSIVTKDDRQSRKSWLARISSFAAAFIAVLTIGGCREEPVTGEISLPAPPTMEPVQTLGEVDVMMGGIGGAAANPDWLSSEQADPKQPEPSKKDVRQMLGRVASPWKSDDQK